MSCKNIVIFYEAHTDLWPAKTIADLFPFFQQKGFKSYCFEEPSDESKEELLALYQSHLSAMRDKAQVTSFEDKAIQNFLASNTLANVEGDGSTSIINKETELSDADKAYILEFVKTTSASMVKSLGATINLINMVGYDTNTHFCTIDMPRKPREALEKLIGIGSDRELELRNLYMKNKILEQCKEGDGVVVLVGADHFKIADLLKKDGVINVKEYYITSEPMSLSDKTTGECLRPSASDHPLCKGHDFTIDGLVIDLYDDPNLNAAQLVKENLRAIYDMHEEL